MLTGNSFNNEIKFHKLQKNIGQYIKQNNNNNNTNTNITVQIVLNDNIYGYIGANKKLINGNTNNNWRQLRINPYINSLKRNARGLQSTINKNRTDEIRVTIFLNNKVDGMITANKFKSKRKRIQNSIEVFLPSGKRSKRIIEFNNKKRKQQLSMLHGPPKKKHKQEKSKSSNTKKMLGSYRKLTEDEKKYFKEQSNQYNNKPVLREHEYNNPSKLWQERLKVLQKRRKIIINEMKLFIEYSKENLQHTERMNWESVLAPLSFGSESRFCWALLFLKSTNNVSDAVSCNHFRILIKKIGNLTMKKLVKDKFFASQILRQCSKWVKNSFAINNICKYIIKEREGNYRLSYNELINFFEMGPKTAALIMYSVFGEITTVPVDSHVYEIAKKLNWSDGTSAEEVAWHFQYLVPDDMKIAINDACGSIKQQGLKNVERVCKGNKRMHKLIKILIK